MNSDELQAMRRYLQEYHLLNLPDGLHLLDEMEQLQAQVEQLQAQLQYVIDWAGNYHLVDGRGEEAVSDKHLFNLGAVILHSGRNSNFFIDCSTLTRQDWEAIAAVVGPKLLFKRVVGVPRGGISFAKALEHYRYPDDTDAPTLIVDDVLTTGASMEQQRYQDGGYCIGVVLFARGRCPDWVVPVFQMAEEKKP